LGGEVFVIVNSVGWGSRGPIALAAVALVAIFGAHPQQAAAPRPAAAVRVQPNGDDTTCVRMRRDRPCRTLDRAYAIARLGDVVEIAGGTYPPQRITQKGDKSAAGNHPDVVMRPVSGHRVRVADLELGSANRSDGPHHLSLENLEDWEDPATRGSGGSCEWAMQPGTSDVTWRGLRACNWYVVGVRDVSIVGGEWGPCTTDGSDPNPCGNNKIDFQPPYPTRNVVIDGGLYHDYRVVPGSSAHFECMFIVGGWNITVRRSKFYNCSYFDIFIQYYNDLDFPRLESTPYDGLIFENNFFGPPQDVDRNELRPTALFFSNLEQSRDYEYRNVLVRYNSFYRSWVSFNDGQDTYAQFRLRNVRLFANIMQRSWQKCGPIQHGYNIYVRAADSERGGCSATDRFVARYPYANPDSGNYHLVPSLAVDRVPAKGAGDLASRRDIDGDSRPDGRARDAGADECRQPRTPPKRTSAAAALRCVP
jgi:hypothetical protein